MTATQARFIPPFCPNPECGQHESPVDWQWIRFGWFRRATAPRRVQRFRCLDCGRCFSTQTFQTTYWLKRPDLPPLIFRGLVECGCLRQIARGLEVRHATVQRQVERLGRHCLLFQSRHAPRSLPPEGLVLDGLRTFEYSQYWPCDLHLLVGARSHFMHGFTDVELRRHGRMRPEQKRRRARLERLFGRPDSRLGERRIEALLREHLPEGVEVDLATDEQHEYARVVPRLERRRIRHVRISSKAPRTPRNPLFAANVADLFIRHSSANQKRETIAFSRRRQAMLERLAVFQVWRNFIKRRSEREPDGPTPAMVVRAAKRPLRVPDVLRGRLFPSRVKPSRRLLEYYERRVATRQIRNGREHALRYAF